MSFDDAGRRYNDYTGYQAREVQRDRGSSANRKTSITNNLMQISNNVASLQKLTNQIGTSRDSQQMREQLNKLVNETRDIATQTAHLLKRWDDNDKDARLQKGKLMKEYQMLLGQFGDIAKYSAEKERSQPLPRSKNESGFADIGGGFGDPGLPQFSNADPKQSILDRDAEFFQRQQQIDFSNIQIEERNESIKELEKSVVEINELFIDVARLLTSPDSIESSVESAVVQTDKGVSELRSASEYQRKSRSKLCILLLLLMIIGAVAVVVIWLLVRK